MTPYFLPQQEKEIVYLGNISKEKNIELFQKKAKKRKELPSFYLFITSFLSIFHRLPILYERVLGCS